VRRAVVVTLLATPGVVAALIASAPAHADPPQCGDGPIVMDGCTSPGVCTAVIDDRCVGVQPPLLPPPGPVRVELDGTVGF
jgi:hypothetical protein